MPLPSPIIPVLGPIKAKFQALNVQGQIEQTQSNKHKILPQYYKTKSTSKSPRRSSDELELRNKSPTKERKVDREEQQTIQHDDPNIISPKPKSQRGRRKSLRKDADKETLIALTLPMPARRQTKKRISKRDPNGRSVHGAQEPFLVFIQENTLVGTMEAFNKMPPQYQRPFELEEHELSQTHSSLRRFVSTVAPKVKSAHYTHTPFTKNLKVCIVGAGIAGIAAAIEIKLVGAQSVNIIEKRNEFTRRNVLHLWPVVVE